MPKVTYLPDERTVEAAQGESLHDVCDREILGIPFSCKNGVCGTCIVKVVKGAEHLGERNERERNTLEMFDAGPEHRLSCQCHVHGDVELDQP